jgi:phage terminase Nu1 subunit (DNA packaging protein)
MNQPEAAALLGITTRTLNNYSTEDPPIPLKRISQTCVEYDPSEIVRWFVAHEVSKALRASGSSADEKRIAETRQAVAVAELREIELGKAKGELVLAADMKQEETRLVLTIRQALLTFPHLLAISFEDGLTYAVRKARAEVMVGSVLKILAQPNAEEGGNDSFVPSKGVTIRDTPDAPLSKTNRAPKRPDNTRSARKAKINRLVEGVL